MNKIELRKTAKEIACTLDENYIKNASEIIQNKIINSDAFKKSNIIFVYVSTQNEVGTEKIIRRALSMNKTVCVPRCLEKGIMQAIKIKSTDELSIGKFGICEPTGDDVMSAEKIDLVIVPCVCASLNGERLGHGGGYYDKFLESCNAVKYCLCFDKLILSEIPMDEFDIYMDKVFTE